MTHCTICGASLGPSDASCPTCGTDRTKNFYAPGEVLVAEILEAPPPEPPLSLPVNEGYGVRLQFEAVLGKTFELFGKVFGRILQTQLVAVLCALPFGAVFVWQMWIGHGDPKSFPPWLWGVLVVGILVLLPIGIATIAGQFLILGNQARGGEPRLKALPAMRQGLRFVGRAVLCYLALMGLYLVTVAPALALIYAKLWWVAVPFILLVVVFWFALFTVWLVPFIPVMVVENRKLGDTLRRCGELVRTCKGKVLGYNLLSGVLMVAVFLVVALISLIPVFGQILYLAFNLIITPLGYAWTFSLYAALHDRHLASMRQV